MPLPTPTMRTTGHFGDIVLADGVVTQAPAVTRIPIADLNTGAYTTDWWGIAVAGTVWYRPFDVDTARLELLCARVTAPPPLHAHAED